MGKTVEQMINDYRISLSKDANGKFDGQIRIYNIARMEADNAKPAIIAAKQAIIAALQEEETAPIRAWQAREAKINAIPGLKQIRAAKSDIAEWHREFNASFDDVGGLGVRPMPKYDIPAMLAEYPAAAAYLEAESYSNAANYVKAAAGKKACDAILDGADPAETVEKMHAEWNAHVDSHIWD